MSAGSHRNRCHFFSSFFSFKFCWKYKVKTARQYHCWNPVNVLPKTNNSNPHQSIKPFSILSLIELVGWVALPTSLPLIIPTAVILSNEETAWLEYDNLQFSSPLFNNGSNGSNEYYPYSLLICNNVATIRGLALSFVLNEPPPYQMNNNITDHILVIVQTCSHAV